MITNSNMAIVCPTKNRPENIRKMLDALLSNSHPPAQILIAENGNSSKAIVNAYSRKIKVQYIECTSAGQVLQRNHALKFIQKNIRIVLLDDDVILEHDTLCELLKIWNTESADCSKPLAAVALNLPSGVEKKKHSLRRFFFMQAYPGGKVTRSGYAQPHSNSAQNAEIEWMTGGATAWSIEILHRHPHPINFSMRWSVCEDLIYSYPLSFKYKFLIAEKARATHSDAKLKTGFKAGIYQGLTATLMRYFFVRLNQTLSEAAYFWMTFGILGARVINLLTLSSFSFGYACGVAIALCKAAKCSLFKRDFHEFIKNEVS